MKTVVYQSFRTTDVPAWIDACMATVRAWAAYRGFDYRFWDDTFFDFVPASLQPRASVHKCLLSDYARVVAGRELLAGGYDRAVWVDADVVVFDPENFAVPVSEGYAFCREVWLDRVSFGLPQFRLTVNNAVSVFCRGETFSEPYLESARSILAGTSPLTPFSIGTQWLLEHRRHTEFPLLTHIGIVGPILAQHYLAADSGFLRAYLRFQTTPVYALNLCLSKAGPDAPENQRLTAETAQNVIDRLLADRGASLNRWFTPGRRHSHREEFGRPLTPYLSFRATLKRLAGREHSAADPGQIAP